MSDLSDLYQEVILDHNRRPRNFGALADPSSYAQGHNPLCGDKLTVYLRTDGPTVTGVQFEGSGCAISKASASLMTEAVAGKSVDDALALFDRFHAALTTPPGQPVDTDALGKLAVLIGVREFPMRVKCASLAWHTLKSAIVRSSEIARTE
jgi:nitrogen fixation NifU-like protein